MSTHLDAGETTDHERDDAERDAGGERLLTSNVEEEDTNVFRVLRAQARTRSIARRAASDEEAAEAVRKALEEMLT